MRIESAMTYKEIALGAFLDKEGAFDRTSFAVITEAAERHGVNSIIVRWINTVLETRNFIATLSGETLEVSAGRRAFAPAVEPGRGRTSSGTQRTMRLCERICR
jgi:hypothetical protein